MSDAPIDTVWLQRCIDHWRAGDHEAADRLFRVVGPRVERLARKMLRGFPTLRDHADTGDIIQGSLLRLLHTLRQLQPESMRHFFNLAAVHIRRELLDLARRYSSMTPVRRTTGGVSVESVSLGPLGQAAAPAEDDDFELWCRFHEAVERLPGDEREVVGLVFYHGWTQVQIADLLGVTERTVRRHWQSACLRLNELVGEKLPQP
jgi:RNA polymerase sigma-70 factor (ECF subfamily)